MRLGDGGQIGVTIVTDIWSYSILLVFCGFFFGYCLGRRQGMREGEQRGLLLAPLDMLRASWHKGACALCGTPSKSRDNGVYDDVDDDAAVKDDTAVEDDAAVGN